jgi:hypothetical protein
MLVTTRLTALATACFTFRIEVSPFSQTLSEDYCLFLFHFSSLYFHYGPSLLRFIRLVALPSPIGPGPGVKPGEQALK